MDYFSRKQQFGVKNVLMLGLLLTNMQLFTSQDINWQKIVHWVSLKTHETPNYFTSAEVFVLHIIEDNVSTLLILIVGEIQLVFELFCTIFILHLHLHLHLCI